jgi:hypothetical protein
MKDYEESVIPVLNEYPFKGKIRKFTSKLPIFKRKEDLEVVSDAVSAHPFLSYRLLRRFSSELAYIMLDFETEIEAGNQNTHLRSLRQKQEDFLIVCLFPDLINLGISIAESMRLPNAEDVNGSADGLIRIQDYYNFDIDNVKTPPLQKLECKNTDFLYILQ